MSEVHDGWVRAHLEKMDGPSLRNVLRLYEWQIEEMTVYWRTIGQYEIDKFDKEFLSDTNRYGCMWLLVRDRMIEIGAEP